MNNYYPFPYYTQPRHQTDYIRPVSSLDEVRASSISFDGSVFYFPDVSHKRIYTKQINLDGTASLNMYELTPIVNSAPASADVEYITRDEFNAALEELKDFMKGDSKNDVKKPVISTVKG